jgi:hypothetical protein
VTDSDDQLMDRLRLMAARIEGRPRLVDDSARAALATRRLDAELAELVLDSAPEEVVAGVRGNQQTRLVSFQAATVTVELQVHESADRLALRGLVSGATGRVVVETTREQRVASIDSDGWFAIGDLPRGSLRLRLQDADGAAVTTSWMSS